MQVKLQWSLQHLDVLTAVADELRARPDGVSSHHGLDRYGAGSVPGQPWKCYRSIGYEEKDHEKDLRARLTELLMPSTAQEDLDRIPKRGGKAYCPYLRFQQKPMNLSEWLVPQEEGKPQVHNGAHYPLCTFTNNSRARSAQKQQERAARYADRQGTSQNPQRPPPRQRQGTSQNSRSRGDRSTTPRPPTDRPQHGAYVHQCIQGAYVSQQPSWEVDSWHRGSWRKDDDWKSSPQW